jgi:hypothetical protein
VVQAEMDTGGPQLSWKNIEKVSAAIRTLRAIRDVFEETINPYRRYKRHCSPSAEADIDRLAQYYQEAGIFKYKARKLTEKEQAGDPLKKGAEALQNTKWLEEWAEKRGLNYSDEQNWALLTEDEPE